MLARSCQKPFSNHLLSHLGLVETCRNTFRILLQSMRMLTETYTYLHAIHFFFFFLNPHLFPRQKNQDLRLFSSCFPSLLLCVFLPFYSFFSKLIVVIPVSFWTLVNYLWSQYTIICQYVIDYFFLCLWSKTILLALINDFQTFKKI